MPLETGKFSATQFLFSSSALGAHVDMKFCIEKYFDHIEVKFCCYHQTILMYNCLILRGETSVFFFAGIKFLAALFHKISI